MIGKIFITRTGYDPEVGKHVKDPYLGDIPTLGACRPDIRKRLNTGDHIFVVSGKVKGFEQFVIGGFECASKVDAIDAYHAFPELRLRKREDGQLTGNIIVDAHGNRHILDDHSTFESRVKNYIIGRRPISLTTPEEISEGRSQTVQTLRDILKKNGTSPFELVGRWGTSLNEEQVHQLIDWLTSIKIRAST